MRWPSLREPGSALTHLAGVLLSLVALGVLIERSVRSGQAWQMVSFPIFGASLLLLYTASTLYHSLRLSPRGLLALRKLDHTMIFLLIAGSYTPFCLGPLWGRLGWTLLVLVWTIAAAGIVLKLCWMSAPRWLSTGIYLGMGWLVVLALPPLVRSLTPACLAWLLTGGVLYTIGAAFYGTKWPNPWPGRFGFHEIWHLFVLGGSMSHFLAVVRL